VAASGFGLAFEQRLGHRVAVLRGELDSAAARGLADRLTAMDKAALVVDLSDLTFISAAGVGELLQAKRQLEFDGTPLVLLGADGMVRRVFGILQMDELLAD
jgi:anti-anti-sigma factor